MRLVFVPTVEGAVSWIASEPGYMQRASHALADEGGVWLIEPVDGEGLRERLAPLGEVRGVIQLFRHHERDGAALAAEFGAPHIVLPFDGVPNAPFRPIPIRTGRRLAEVALWWSERAALVVSEAVGTVGYFRAGQEPVGVHPFARIAPPRMLSGIGAEVLLPGHGPPLIGPGTGEAVAAAVARARRDIPRWLLALPRSRRRSAEELDRLRRLEKE